MSISHCTFWVTRARLDVRLWKREVESRASLPARSRLRIQAKKPARMSAPTTIRRITIRPTLVSAAMMPPTRTTRPAADRTLLPCRRGGSGRRAADR